VRLSRCEVRDHINYRKNDRWRSSRFYRAMQRLKSPMRYICEIFGAPRFSSFSTQSARSGHPMTDKRLFLFLSAAAGPAGPAVATTLTAYRAQASAGLARSVANFDALRIRQDLHHNRTEVGDSSCFYSPGHSLSGSRREHGRSIPFSDFCPSPTSIRRALMNWADVPVSGFFRRRGGGEAIGRGAHERSRGRRRFGW
jgi:hypothetical protein